MRAWTYFQNPFSVGGNTHQAKGFEFQGKKKVDLGKGYFGYGLKSPKGTTIIVESRSGAIIGNSIKMVKNDIQKGDFEVMKNQIDRASKVPVTIIPEHDFWIKYE